MATTDEPGGLLHPLQILDLTEGAAGFCSRLLADLGASVIKVERPGGDTARRTGPFRRPGSFSGDQSLLPVSQHP